MPVIFPICCKAVPISVAIQSSGTLVESALSIAACACKSSVACRVFVIIIWFDVGVVVTHKS